MIEEKCGNCRFYNLAVETKRSLIDDEELNELDYESECRRYPPKIGDEGYHGKLGKFFGIADCYAHPTVNTKDWCGEYKQT